MEPQKRLFRNYVFFSCLITVLLIVLVLFSYRARILERADLLLYDLHFRWRGPLPTSGNTVLVLMDQKSARCMTAGYRWRMIFTCATAYFSRRPRRRSG